MSELPLFPVAPVGSWPRSPALLRAQKLKQRGRLSADEFAAVADDAVEDVLRLQLEAGIDFVTDGEQRRDNFFSFVADKLKGVRLMTLAEMLDIVEDRAAFERILNTLDVPAYAISNATCVGKLERSQPLAVDELRFLKSRTDRPVKIALPGPYLLTRAMYVPSVSARDYPSKEALGRDVVGILREEIEELESEGVDFIQLDEPVLTELVFTQGETRTFMCGALAARGDPSEELEFAVSLINEVVQAARNVRTGLHVCRGNWSRDESTLLRGSYYPLLPYLNRIEVDQLVLEYATERAGELLPFGSKEVGLGVVNPRTSQVESSSVIAATLERAMRQYATDKIWVNPDCGFGTFSNRPVATPEIAAAKLRAIVEAVAAYREAPRGV